MEAIKARAALVAVLGLGIIAWSLTIAPSEDYPGTMVSRAVANGYTTFFGAALCLVGAYRWITVGK